MCFWYSVFFVTFVCVGSPILGGTGAGAGFFGVEGGSGDLCCCPGLCSVLVIVDWWECFPPS